MATLGAGGFAPILAALSTMQSNAERSEKSQAHNYLEKFQKSVRRVQICLIHLINQPDIHIARSLVNDTLYTFFYRCHRRSKVVCRDDIERKGQGFLVEMASACLTSPTDYVRPRPAPPTITYSSTRFDSQPPNYLSRWTQTHQNAAMCVSCQSSHTDARMEGCPTACGVNVGGQRWRLCS